MNADMALVAAAQRPDTPLGALVGAALRCPLIAIDLDNPTVLHAVTWHAIAEVIGDPDRSLVAACGDRDVKIVPGNLSEDSPITALMWPPRIRGDGGLPRPLSRCSACYVATGRPRPRTEATAL